MQCVRKTNPLDCAQWSGGNAVEIANLMGCIIGNPPYDVPFVCGGLSFAVGDWVVVENGVSSVYTDPGFQSAFVAI